ncbi:MAG TPA: carbohydrate ABC transporter permease [Kofleriaceae bacterium]|nr:carbohydrate ABC transporter permease [Kofleriaceae bacterium]
MMKKLGHAAFQLVFWLVVAIILFYVLFPFYWALKTSLTPPDELARTALHWFPEHPTLSNYVEVFRAQPFGRNLFNSFVVAMGTVLVSLLLAAPAAYALGKFRFRGKRPLLYAILAVSVFPQIALLPGLYTVVQWLHLYNSWGALVLSYLIFTLPFTVWTLTAFVRQIPTEIEEAAIVDGATALGTLFRVLLPVMTPALVTTGLLAFINAWNEFLFALTFTSDDSARTVPVAIGSFTGASEHESPFTLVMAGSVLVTVPLVALVLIFQRKIVAGLTAGAVKG